MSKPVVRIQNLSKRFFLQKQGGHALSVAITDRIRQVLFSNEKGAKEFWALKNISFDISPGEIVSLIGNNGSGKSTLLKIIAKVMKATSGSVEVKGTLRALLEVGTGFHHELSGRENIFFNSTLLGVSRADTKKHLDAIIDFSGVEEYIDIPIKYYSSGMKVRLGFAIATQFHPDVLILDEVLTVGDIGFRQKSLERIESITQNFGTTTLFVSHNLSTVQSLCDKAIWLQDGQMQTFGEIDDVLESYKEEVLLQTQKKLVGAKNFGKGIVRKWSPDDPEAGNDFIRLHRVKVSNTDTKEEDNLIYLKKPIKIEVEFDNKNPKDRMDITFQFISGLNEIFMVSSTAFEESMEAKFGTGRWVASCTIPAWFFNSGIIYIDVLFHKNKTNKAIFRKNKVLSFPVVPDPVEFGILHRRTKGAVRPVLEWEVRGVDSKLKTD